MEADPAQSVGLRLIEGLGVSGFGFGRAVSGFGFGVKGFRFWGFRIQSVRGLSKQVKSEFALTAVSVLPTAILTYLVRRLLPT